MYNLRYNKVFYSARQIVKRLLSWIYPIVVWAFPLPKVLSIDDTLQLLLKSNKSIIRFGDGEFLYIFDKINLPFQRYDKKLAQKLINILSSDQETILIGLPSGYHSTNLLSKTGKRFWRAQIAWIYPRLRKYLRIEKIYANASITRLYAEYQDKSNCKNWFELFMKIWDNKEIVLIEGEKSRIGVGNELFAGAKSVERILGPKHHAFSKYEELLNVARMIECHKLILIALGPCAKPLAYELAMLGHRVIDIGNLDIEFEWYLRGAKTKTKIPGKYTSEAIGGREVDDINDLRYHNEIKEIVT